MRKCPRCEYVIDNDALILCPRCKQSPHELSTVLPPDVYKRLRRDVIKSFFLWVFGPFTALGFLGYILLIRSGINDAHRQIQSRITQEFKQPVIADVVTRVAENQAKAILERQVKPALDQLKSSTSEIEKTKIFAEQFRAQYESKLAAVEDQLTRLERYNTITALASRAIAEG